MHRIKREHPIIDKEWMIVGRESRRDFVKKAYTRNLTGEELKKKMEELIEEVVCKSVEFESEGDKVYESQEDQKENLFANRKTMKGDVRHVQYPCYSEARAGISQQFEERKRKLLQKHNWKRIEGIIKPPEERKLRNVCGKLENANDKLKLLLVKADEEPIKENVPKAAREKCWEAWYTGTNTSSLIKHIISQNKRQHIEDYYSAGKKSLTRTKAMVNLLEAIVDSLRAEE